MAEASMEGIYLIIYREEVYAYLWVMDSARIIVLDGRTDTPLHS